MAREANTRGRRTGVGLPILDVLCFPPTLSLIPFFGPSLVRVCMGPLADRFLQLQFRPVFGYLSHGDSYLRTYPKMPG